MTMPRRILTLALSDLNHLFRHRQTGAIAEYGTIEETMNPEVLTLVSDWILDEIGTRNRERRHRRLEDGSLQAQAPRHTIALQLPTTRED